MNNLYNLVYGTKYFDYMLTCDAYLESLFLDYRHFYKFPFDGANVFMLCDTNLRIKVRKELEKMKRYDDALRKHNPWG